MLITPSFRVGSHLMDSRYQSYILISNKDGNAALFNLKTSTIKVLSHDVLARKFTLKSWIPVHQNPERLWMQAYLRHKNDKRLLTRLGFRMNPKRIKEIFEFDVI